MKIRTPTFWYAPHPEGLAHVLKPLGALYGVLTARRMARPGVRAVIPVICVGNFTAGGAGKTPTVIALAALLHAQGHRPAVISRGYGGSLAGPVVVDPAQHGSAEVGDEPLLIAAQAETIVARDRPAGVALAAERGATLALLDDGLQSPALAKDLSLVVVDGAVGNGNGLCIPAGPLRAPLAAQWPRADAVVIIGAGRPGETVARQAQAFGKPVFHAHLVPEPAAAARLRGKRVFALAGIGRPEKFTATLRELGADLAGVAFFPDHHAYSADDAADVAAEASGHNATVVTTEKDAMRLGALWREANLGPLAVLPVSLVFEEPKPLGRLLSAVLEAGRA